MNKHARASSNHYHYHCKQLYDNHYKNLPQTPAKQKADININKKVSFQSFIAGGTHKKTQESLESARVHFLTLSQQYHIYIVL